MVYLNTPPPSQPFIVLMEDELVHTDERPFCDDQACPCHDDTSLIKTHIVRPWFDGLLTGHEANRLFQGWQF